MAKWETPECWSTNDVPGLSDVVVLGDVSFELMGASLSLAGIILTEVRQTHPVSSKKKSLFSVFSLSSAFNSEHDIPLRYFFLFASHFMKYLHVYSTTCTPYPSINVLCL